MDTGKKKAMVAKDYKIRRGRDGAQRIFSVVKLFCMILSW